MSSRTVRMGDEDERRLARIRRTTGWTASEALKRGLEALETNLSQTPVKSAYEIFLELGVEPAEPRRDRASRSRDLAREAILRKHGRRSSGPK